MPVINPDDYNQARSVLAQAGSNTAGKSHPKHNKDSVPEGHGAQLLREARDEFRGSDAGGGTLQSGMTQAHYDAVHKAAGIMGISNW